MIAEVLGVGADNAKHTAEVMQLCGFGSAREMRKQVERERREGVFICSDDNGYYLPREGIEGFNDIRKTYNRETKRARTSFYNMRHFGKALGEVFGQIGLFDEEGNGDNEERK